MNDKQLDNIPKFNSKTTVKRTSLAHIKLYLYASELMPIKPNHKCNSFTHKRGAKHLFASWPEVEK